MHTQGPSGSGTYTLGTGADDAFPSGGSGSYIFTGVGGAVGSSFTLRLQSFFGFPNVALTPSVQHQQSMTFSPDISMFFQDASFPVVISNSTSTSAMGSLVFNDPPLSNNIVILDSDAMTAWQWTSDVQLQGWNQINITWIN